MKKYILSIEDNADDIALMERIFCKEIEVADIQHIKSGEEALKNINETDFFVNYPSLILLDIKMKGINGLTVLKEIKKHKNLAKIPVIIFSSSVQKADVDKAYKYKVNSYIEKPKDYQKLKETVKVLVNYWLEYNKN